MRARYVLALALATTSLCAQTTSGSSFFTDPYAIRFADIKAAETQQWFSLTQFRFVLTTDPRDGQERWVGLVENLSSAPPTATSPEHPRFDLRLASGLGLNPAEEARQQSVHHPHRAYLHLYGSFRVHDAALANANYTLRFEGACNRLGRACFRVAVLPNSTTANIWLVDLDVETGYPLIRTEYTPQGRMVSMLSVVAFEHGQAARASIGNDASWWTGANRRTFSSPRSAIAAIGNASVKMPPAPPSGFALRQSSVHVDALTGDKTLVLDYTDGIESLQLLQNPSAPKPRLGMFKDDKAYAIMEFADLRSTQLLFHVKGVEYQVLGGSDDARTNAFAEDTLRAALR